MVREEYSVSLKSIVEEQDLTVLHAAKDFDTARVAHRRRQPPGAAARRVLRLL